MGESLGEFEKLLLLAVLQLDEGAYGAAIIQRLTERTGRDVSPGAVYVVLRRLEAKGLLRSRVGEPTPERGGRSKRYYEASPQALQLLREARAVWEAMLAGLESRLESES